MLRYGDLTANGRAGGLAGLKVDSAVTAEASEATKRPRRYKFIVNWRDGGGDDASFLQQTSRSMIYFQRRFLFFEQITALEAVEKRELRDKGGEGRTRRGKRVCSSVFVYRNARRAFISGPICIPQGRRITFTTRLVDCYLRQRKQSALVK